MSLVDSLPPLPPILKRQDAMEVKFVEAKEEEVKDKRFIIVCSRDLKEEDLDIFRSHGKVQVWREALVNMDFSALEFDFLIIDLRSKNARLTLSRQDLKQYNVVAYVFAIQKDTDDFIDELGAVAISSIPKSGVNMRDFCAQLLNSKITSPSLVKSFLRLVLSCVSK